MEAATLNRMLVEITVEKALREMESDPARPLRRIIDTAGALSLGPNRKRLFSFIASMMKDEKSPYYAAIRHLLSSVDRTRLVTFGTNLGFMGFAVSSNLIREHSKALSRRLPVSIALSVEGEEGLLAAADRISEAAALGQSVYFLAPKSKKELLGLSEILSGYRYGAFILFCNPADFDSEAALFCRRYPNLMLSFPLGGKHLADAVTLSKQARLLYSFHAGYSKDTLPSIESGELAAAAASLGGTVLFLNPFEGCDEKTLAAVEKTVMGERKNPKYPCFVTDLCSDLGKVNAIITGGVSFDGFSSARKKLGILKAARSLSTANAVLFERLLHPKNTDRS